MTNRFVLTVSAVCALALASCASNASSESIGAPNTLSSGKLIEMTEKVRHGSAPADAAPSTSSMASKPFSILAQPASSDLNPGGYCAGAASMRYDDARNTLKIVLLEGSPSDDRFKSTFGGAFTSKRLGRRGRRSVKYLSFNCSMKDLGVGTVKNDYALSPEQREYTISKKRQSITALGHFPLKPRSAYHTVGLVMSETEARNLMPHVRLRYTGTLDNWPDGNSFFCGSHNTLPSYDSPKFTEHDVCMFNAEISAIEVIDSRDGSVLHAFDAPEYPEPTMD